MCGELAKIPGRSGEWGRLTDWENDNAGSPDQAWRDNVELLPVAAFLSRHFLMKDLTNLGLSVVRVLLIRISAPESVSRDGRSVLRPGSKCCWTWCTITRGDQLDRRSRFAMLIAPASLWTISCSNLNYAGTGNTVNRHPMKRMVMNGCSIGSK
jgi:hypothetical protein